MSKPQRQTPEPRSETAPIVIDRERETRLECLRLATLLARDIAMVLNIATIMEVFARDGSPDAMQCMERIKTSGQG